MTAGLVERIRETIGQLLRRWSDRLVAPGEKPDQLRTVWELIEIATRAPDPDAAVRRLAARLNVLDEELHPRLLLLTAMVFREPPKDRNVATSAEVAAWARETLELIDMELFRRELDDLGGRR